MLKPIINKSREKHINCTFHKMLLFNLIYKICKAPELRLTYSKAPLYIYAHHKQRGQNTNRQKNTKYSLAYTPITILTYTR